MYRYIRRDGRTERVDRYTGRRWRRVWPRSRAGRWLLWLLILVVVLIILSQLFGGFQKGTKVGGLGFLSGASHVGTASVVGAAPEPAPSTL
jgi:hypothetical protein